MGKEKEKDKKGSDLRNWVPIQGTGFEDGIVREQNTGREGEKRTYILDSFYAPKNEDFIYKFRRDTKAPLVAAYGSELVKNIKAKKDGNERLSKQDKKTEKERKKNVYMTAVTEHIPHRLSDTPQLIFPESLYVLDRSLQGYETAYNRVGPMWVNDRMFGFTPEGYSKVWVNEDFANNHPSHPRKLLDSTREDGSTYLEAKNLLPVTRNDEADFVENIIDVVADHTEQGRYPEPFSSQIHQKGFGFRDARRFIRDYAVSNNIFVPDRVDFWNNRCWGWRNTKRTTQYIPPVTQTTHGYRFNYLPPDHAYEPEIFASRMGEHGVFHGHQY